MEKQLNRTGAKTIRKNAWGHKSKSKRRAHKAARRFAKMIVTLV